MQVMSVESMLGHSAARCDLASRRQLVDICNEVHDKRRSRRVQYLPGGSLLFYPTPAQICHMLSSFVIYCQQVKGASSASTQRQIYL